MGTLSAIMLCAVLFGTSLSYAGTDIRQEPVTFKSGAEHSAVTGHIKGRETVDHLVRVRAGQTLRVDLKAGNRFTFFNILPPGSDEAIFVGSSSGNSFERRLQLGGEYRVRTYLMRNAARRGESTRYKLDLTLKGAGMFSQSFEKTLVLQGISFQVTSANNSSINTLRIVPSGLEIDNSQIDRTIDGTVTGVEVADINADGSPEIYVYVTSAGSGSYGSLVAYSANRLKSLSEIYLPPVTQDTDLSRGYRGHDEFAVVEGILARRFPVYRDSDTNTTPTGGMRQLQYKLIPGEAGWLLRLDRTVEY